MLSAITCSFALIPTYTTGFHLVQDRQLGLQNRVDLPEVNERKTVSQFVYPQILVYSDPRLGDDILFNIEKIGPKMFACIDDIVVGEIDPNIKGEHVTLLDIELAAAVLHSFFNVRIDKIRRTVIGAYDWQYGTDTWKWPAGIIPITVDYTGWSDELKTNFAKAIRTMSDSTSISIVTRTTEPSFVEIFSAGGCFASMGRSGSGVMGLSNTCTHGAIVHEFLHAFGFHHEHVRSDRDTYVVVTSSDSINYGKLDDGTRNRGDYDYGSM